MITRTPTQLRLEFPPTDIVSTTLQTFGAKHASTNGGLDFRADRETNVLTYDRPHVIAKDEQYSGLVSNVAKMTVEGTINWASVWLWMNDGHSVCLRILPRTTEGRQEMHDTLLALREFFGIPLTVNEAIDEWWNISQYVT